MKKHALSLVLTIACVFVGYAFWRMNHYRDGFVWIVLTIGLLGILLSVLRNAKT